MKERGGCWWVFEGLISLELFAVSFFPPFSFLERENKAAEIEIYLHRIFLTPLPLTSKATLLFLYGDEKL